MIWMRQVSLTSPPTIEGSVPLLTSFLHRGWVAPTWELPLKRYHSLWHWPHTWNQLLFAFLSNIYSEYTHVKKPPAVSFVHSCNCPWRNTILEFKHIFCDIVYLHVTIAIHILNKEELWKLTHMRRPDCWPAASFLHTGWVAWHGAYLVIILELPCFALYLHLRTKQSSFLFGDLRKVFTLLLAIETGTGEHWR